MSGELPIGWTRPPLGELFERINRRNRAGVTRVLTASGDQGLIDQAEFFNKSVAGADLSNYLHIKRGEFAYNRSAMSGYPVGAVKRLDRYGEGVVSSLYLCFGLREGGTVSGEFAAQVFGSRTLEDDLRVIAKVGARAHGLLNVSADDFMSIRFPLPPLAEQKKIAAILSSVDEAIKATQAVIDQTRRVKEGLLQDLLTRGLPGHTRFKQTEIGEIPESWEVGQVGALFEVQLGKMMSEDARKGPNQKPYLRNINVRWRHIVLDDLDTIAFDSREMLKFALRVGDILMCEGRALGRSAIWKGDIAECYYQKALHRLRSRGSMLPEFLLNYSFLAFEVADIFRGERLESTIPHLTKERLEKLPVPVPPIHEQAAIVARLDSLWAEEEFGNEMVGALTATKSGLLQDLLTGCVRVAT